MDCPGMRQAIRRGLIPVSGGNMSLKHFYRLAIAIGLAGTFAATSAQEVNKLNADETRAGYDLLFNGTDLSNWHAYRLTAVTAAWTVKNNAPLGPRIENLNNDPKLPILTNKKYTNFDLKIDVQTPADGNSGVFTRYEEIATQPGNARSGPEMQICGPADTDCAGETKHLGSCYDMFGVKASIRTTWANPPGQWNQMRIIAFDSNYVHYGNGKKLLEYKIGTQDFLRAYNESKYVSDGNNGRYYHIHPGGFLLQHHGEYGMTFRNVKAKELPLHPFKKEFPDGKWPETLSHEFAFAVPTSVAYSPEREVLGAITAETGSADLTLVRVAAEHSGFQAVGLDGRAVAFRKVSDGAYAFTRASNPSSLVVVRVRAGGRVVSKVVSLQ